MTYSEKRLYDGERILYRGKFHWTSYIWAWTALILLGILVIGIFIFIYEIVKRHVTEFVITDRRVILKKGVFTADVQEMTLDAIEGSTIEQGVFGRLLGYGDLVIRGRGESEIVFPTMAHPGKFRAEAEHSRHDSEVEAAEVIADEINHARPAGRPVAAMDALHYRA